MSKISQKLRWQDWYRKRKWLEVCFRFKKCSSNMSQQAKSPYFKSLNKSDSILTVSLFHKPKYTNIYFCTFALTIFMGFMSIISMLITPSAPAKLQFQKFNTFHISFHPYSILLKNVKNEKASSDSELSLTEEVFNIVSKTFDKSRPNETITPDIEQNVFGIPQVMYLHLDEFSDDPNFYWVPKVIEQRISDSDIAIDLSDFLDSSLAYELNDFEKNLVNLIVHRESNGEPFMGQVLVAEDILNRFRSGIYGPDKIAILAWYGLETDDDGTFHVYNGSEEILEASASVKSAVDLALKGSNLSYFFLKATVDFQNEQYGLELGDIYYRNGAMYHFAPRHLTDEKAIENRTINRIPVSFSYKNQVFYGHWLSEKYALQIF